jgi:hypothetical protein
MSAARSEKRPATIKFLAGKPIYGPTESSPEAARMSLPNHNGQYVRRVVLPSGRAIEVVYYETTALPSPALPPLDDLHVCPECDRELVYPVEWEEASATHWEVMLRCPNCEWAEVGTFDQATVDRFDEQLDNGTEALIRDLKRLTRANMEEEIDRFTAALTSDDILPEDF